MDRVELPPKFVIPGGTLLSAAARPRPRHPAPRRAPHRLARRRRRARLRGARRLRQPRRRPRLGDGPLHGRRRPRPLRRPRQVKRPEIVATRRAGFDHELELGPSHSITVDEPPDAGGTDHGPAPGKLLAGSLAGCTAITIEMYADRKGWDLDGLAVGVETEGTLYGGDLRVRGRRLAPRGPRRGAARPAAQDRRQVPRPQGAGAVDPDLRPHGDHLLSLAAGELTGRVSIVTGASRGIGRETARPARGRRLLRPARRPHRRRPRVRGRRLRRSDRRGR